MDLTNIKLGVSVPQQDIKSIEHASVRIKVFSKDIREAATSLDILNKRELKRNPLGALASGKWTQQKDLDNLMASQIKVEKITDAAMQAGQFRALDTYQREDITTANAYEAVLGRVKGQLTEQTNLRAQISHLSHKSTVDVANETVALKNQLSIVKAQYQSKVQLTNEEKESLQLEKYKQTALKKTQALRLQELKALETQKLIQQQLAAAGTTRTARSYLLGRVGDSPEDIKANRMAALQGLKEYYTKRAQYSKDSQVIENELAAHRKKGVEAGAKLTKKRLDLVRSAYNYEFAQSKDIKKSRQASAKANESHFKREMQMIRQRSKAGVNEADIKKQLSTLNTRMHRKDIALTKEGRLALSAYSAQTKKMISKTHDVTKATKKYGDAQRNLHGLIRGVGGATGRLWMTYANIIPLMAGFAVTAGMKGMLSWTVNFDKQMTTIRALTQDTVGNIDSVSDSLLNIQSIEGPNVLAQGMRILAKAGVEARDAIQGIEEISLLAMAGELSMAEAAKMATTAMRQFSLSADDLPRIADVIAYTASSANMEVQEMGTSMAYTTELATLMGVEIEEAAAAIAILHDKGIRGSKAGVALRTSMVRLAAPTGKARDALYELGYSVFDAEGNVKDFLPMIEGLADALEGLPKEDEIRIMEALAGKRALKGLQELVTAFREGRLADKIDEIKRKSDGFLDNFKKTVSEAFLVKWQEFVSSVERLSILNLKGGSFHDWLDATITGMDKYVGLLERTSRASQELEYLKSLQGGAGAGRTTFVQGFLAWKEGTVLQQEATVSLIRAQYELDKKMQEATKLIFKWGTEDQKDQIADIVAKIEIAHIRIKELSGEYDMEGAIAGYRESIKAYQNELLGLQVSVTPQIRSNIISNQKQADAFWTPILDAYKEEGVTGFFKLQDDLDSIFLKDRDAFTFIEIRPDMFKTKKTRDELNVLYETLIADHKKFYAAEEAEANEYHRFLQAKKDTRQKLNLEERMNLLNHTKLLADIRVKDLTAQKNAIEYALKQNEFLLKNNKERRKAERKLEVIRTDLAVAEVKAGREATVITWKQLKAQEDISKILRDRVETTIPKELQAYAKLNVWLNKQRLAIEMGAFTIGQQLKLTKELIETEKLLTKEIIRQTLERADIKYEKVEERLDVKSLDDYEAAVLRLQLAYDKGRDQAHENALAHIAAGKDITNVLDLRADRIEKLTAWEITALERVKQEHQVVSLTVADMWDDAYALIGAASDTFADSLIENNFDNIGEAFADLVNDMLKQWISTWTQMALIGDSMPGQDISGGILGFGLGIAKDIFTSGSGFGADAAFDSGVGELVAGIQMHSGGIVGRDGKHIMAPASLFHNAPYLHNGLRNGLRNDEFPAILKRGEEVTPEGKTKDSSISMSFSFGDIGGNQKMASELKAEIGEQVEQIVIRKIKEYS